jgi:hypothetical protein
LIADTAYERNILIARGDGRGRLAALTLRPEDQFHVGIVATDFEATLAELSALFGYQWCDEMGGPTSVRLPTGDALLDLRCVYSRNAPRLEIIRPIPGTLWVQAAGSGIHHIGYWSDDVAADCAALERDGYVPEAARHDPGAGGAPFAFYRSAAGFRVELVSRAIRPSMERLWAAKPAAGV